MATSIIQKVARQAYQTFGRAIEPAVQQERLVVLNELMTKVSCEEVNFDEKLLTRGEINGDGKRVSEGAVGPCVGSSGLPDDVHDQHDDEHAPVTYVHLWEDPAFSMGLFVLRRGVTLPLHDHPGMHGLIKVIHGKCLIKSYTRVSGGRIPADVRHFLKKNGVNPDFHCIELVNKIPDISADASTSPCVLSPEKANFHEIKSVDGPMAFLDILAPPYDHATQTRVCHYYSDLSVTKGAVRCLVQVPQPMYFWCDQATYTGPELSPEIVTGVGDAYDDNQKEL